MAVDTRQFAPASPSPRAAARATILRGCRLMAAAVLLLLAGYTVSWVAVSGTILGASLWARATTAPPAPDQPAPHLPANPPEAADPGVADGDLAAAAGAEIGHLRAVDGHLWRGAAPTLEGYRQLAAHGIRTVIDLRREPGAVPDARITATGLRLVHLPLTDGYAPTPEQVRRFLAEVRGSPRPVFVHCNAGVGRTGSMSAAWLVATGQADPQQALRRSLAVGPPSLEQVAFMHNLDAHSLNRGTPSSGDPEHDGPRGGDPAPDGVRGGDPDTAGDRPLTLVQMVSRALDAPRKLWGRLV